MRSASSSTHRAASSTSASGEVDGDAAATLLDPAQRHARDALARGAEACRAGARDLGAADTAFGATDDAGAAVFGR